MKMDERERSVDEILELLNAGVDPECLGVTLVEEENEEESDGDFYRRHFRVREVKGNDV